jgi:hypothetical protein
MGNPVVSGTAVLRVEVITSKTAAEFLAKLIPSPDEIGPPDFTSPWVYRGHADEAWELKPSAWREDGVSKLAPLQRWLAPHVDMVTMGREPHRLQLVTEVFAVRQFCDLADELGLLIPGADELLDLDDIIQLACTGGISRRIGERKPPLELFPDVPFAFAQHHGIPTRYLDWTRVPLVAAFFATEEIPPDNRKSDEICVWAANVSAVVSLEATLPQWIQVPRGAHGFVHAQSGVFLFCGDRYGMIQPEPTGNIPMKKYTLPVSATDELRRRLFGIHRISRAHLMPTLDNVAAVTKARWSW